MSKLKGFKLPKKVKAKWVAALRSGKYEQTTQNLREEDPEGKVHFCCLGVAKELCLPYAIQRESVQLLVSAFMPPDIQDILISYNDGNEIHNIKRRSFNWIAGYIERYL